jgi:hypothetical protein
MVIRQTIRVSWPTRADIEQFTGSARTQASTAGRGKQNDGDGCHRDLHSVAQPNSSGRYDAATDEEPPHSQSVGVCGSVQPSVAICVRSFGLMATSVKQSRVSSDDARPGRARGVI